MARRQAFVGMLSGSVIPPDRKLAGIHGLRAVAALMIIVFHTRGIPQLTVPDWLWLVPNRFGLGVHLFFLLSAFSLAHSTTVSTDGLKVYWIKRFFRIAPLFYCMLLWYQLWFSPQSLATNVINLSFVFGLIPSAHTSIVWAGWTIGVEMIFYAMLPFLLGIARTCTSALILALAAVVVSAAGRVYLEHAADVPIGYAHSAFVSNLGVFCLGLFVHRLFAQSTDRSRDARIAWVVTLAFAVLLLGPFRGQILPARLDLTVWVVGFGALLFWQALRPSYVLSHPVLQFMGERSYSMYLLHPFIVHQLRGVYAWIYESLGRPGVAFLLCAALSIAAVVACSTVTYWLIEAPGIRFGNWLIRRQRLQALAKSQQAMPAPALPVRTPPAGAA